MDAPARRSLAAPIGVTIAFSLAFIARTSFVVAGERFFTLFDDGMISMRYARNLATGSGLVWNAGQQPVEGYTNFLWTLWMSALHVLPVAESKISLLVMLTGAAILCANLAIVQRVAAAVSPDSSHAPSTAVWLTAVYYPLIYWTLRGMEVGFVTLTISSCVLFALRLASRYRQRDVAALAALMSAGLLTRPDVIVPCAIVAAFAVATVDEANRRTVAVVLLTTAAATIAAHAAFRLAYYGDALPNTYYLKVSGSALSARLARGLRGLLVVGALHFMVPFALAGACVVARARDPRLARGAYLLAALFLSACAYSVYVGGDAWDSMLYANRYVTPAVPGLLVLTALAIDTLAHDRTIRPSTIVACAAVFILVAVLTSIAPLATHGLAATTVDSRLRIVRVAVVATPVLVLPVLARAPRLAAAVLTIATIVATNGFGLALWLGHNAFYADEDAWTTRYGLALREATSADATIAVTWAGAIPYFSHRTSVDLLGKSDRVVAKGPPQPSAGFDPGHDKWDYGYSVGRLRPDVVAQLWHATDADATAIEAFGYQRVAPWVFVRSDSHRVDVEAVQRVACRILREDPFVLGSTTVTLPDHDVVLHRYCRE